VPDPDEAARERFAEGLQNFALAVQLKAEGKLAPSEREKVAFWAGYLEELFRAAQSSTRTRSAE
jgi:hypothetical protein